MCFVPTTKGLITFPTRGTNFSHTWEKLHVNPCHQINPCSFENKMSRNIEPFIKNISQKWAETIITITCRHPNHHLVTS